MPCLKTDRSSRASAPKRNTKRQCVAKDSETVSVEKRI